MLAVYPYLLIVPRSKVPETLTGKILGKVQADSDAVGVDLGSDLSRAQEQLEAVAGDLGDSLLIRDPDRKLRTLDFASRSGDFWLIDQSTPVPQASA